MPFVYDFSKCMGDKKDNVFSVEVSPKGWREGIVVEYGVAQAHDYDPVKSIVWRVRGTSHTFTIYEQTINRLSHGDYKKHFEEVLERFRLDYLQWFELDEYKEADWKYEYESQYGKLILPKDEGDKCENKQD